MQKALAEQKANNDIQLHRVWIKSLLTLYYDPMYEYQLKKKQKNLVFSGGSHQILSNQKKILDMD